jgi:alpha-L-fucosidase
MEMKKLILVIPMLFANIVNSQNREEVPIYTWPKDELVLERLEHWQDLKFGLLMHWGIYSQWGIVESWSICPEDYPWRRQYRTKGSNPQDYITYKNEYENLKVIFNPVAFNPEKWAKAAKKAGMKYVIFTTKHHDRFCMYDSKYTDYKITDDNCPFSVNPKADITKEIFNGFRNEGMWIGAYFSKPDWSSKYFWDPKFPPFDRNVNYDPETYPEKWEKFVEFTHNQIIELMTDYGPIDILWLDGSCVKKKTNELIMEAYHGKLQRETKSGFIRGRIVNQDIRMDELAAKARQKRPELLVVDCSVRGPNQNYLTLENRVPEEPLPYPWESCIIAGGGWSWRPDAEYMTTKQLINMLVDIVAKGGNLLLNIGPRPDGDWDKDVYKVLEEMGKWMEVNREAIYSTRPIDPNKIGNIFLTKQKDTKAVYAISLEHEDGSGLPNIIEIDGIYAAKDAKLNLLGSKDNLKWQNTSDGLNVLIPDRIRKNPPCGLAWTVKISNVK